MTKPFTADLGPVVMRTNVRSSLGPFNALPKYQIQYPEVVTRALGELYDEYNGAFGRPVEKNKEWDTDYALCRGADGSPVNFGVQIDMVSLPPEFLLEAPGMSVGEVREVLRRHIFEIENSLAMYQLLERLFAKGSEDSVFRTRFRPALAKLRAKLGKPIALLAVTDQKYAAMMASEFGKEPGDAISDEEVAELSGFDRFFGPKEFRRHVEENGGESAYALYVRSSDPVAKLKDPKFVVEHPLLGDPRLRRAVKAASLTMNVDAPEMPFSTRINDTKEYQLAMGMAFGVASESDVFSEELISHLRAGRGSSYSSFAGSSRLTPQFMAFLETQGLDPEQVASGGESLRWKPMLGTYGCYGHVKGKLTDGELRKEVRRSLTTRGPYVVQREMKIPEITNSWDGRRFTSIDRVFCAWVDGSPEFLGGFRSLMPADTLEAMKGRNHGNGQTVWAEIA